MKAWKASELEVSKYFKGLRRVRIQYDESIGDVIHPHFSLEVKYGKQIPKYLDVEFPTMLKVARRGVKHRWYKVIPSTWLGVRDKRIWCCTLFYETNVIATAKFLESAMKQAKRYNPTLRPVVCVKPKRRRGFICVWEI